MLGKTALQKIPQRASSMLQHCQASSFSVSERTEKRSSEDLFAMLEEEQENRELKIKQKNHKFEREWKNILKDTVANKIYESEGLLPETQRRRVELLAEHYLDLNGMELRYLDSVLSKRAHKKSVVYQDRIGNSRNKNYSKPEYTSWPPANPNWAQQQEVVAMLWPLGHEAVSKIIQEAAKEAALAAGIDLDAIPQQQEAVVEEKKEEAVAPKEKTHYDIELSVIDAAQKIKIIKEVRQLLGLGLKEAKDLVEKAPTTLKKEVKKEEAEDLKGKLEAVGCTIALL